MTVIVLLNGCRAAKQAENSSELFEGVIEFENSIVAVQLSGNDQEYYNVYGNIQIITFSKGRFVNEFPNGSEYKLTLYNNESNNYYMFYRLGEV